MSIKSKKSEAFSLAVIIAFIITAIVIVIFVLLMGMCYFTNRRREKEDQAQQGLEVALRELTSDVEVRAHSADADTTSGKKL